METTAERDSFLNDIIANPDDDGRRLIYADWLEETGTDPERAEFIRIQCRLDSLRATCICARCLGRRGGGQHHNGPCAAGRERDENGKILTLREQELLGSNAEAWGSLTRPPVEVVEETWSRGFIHSITCHLMDWLQFHKAILRQHPIQEVRLTNWSTEFLHYEDVTMTDKAFLCFFHVSEFVGNPIIVDRGSTVSEDFRALWNYNWPNVKLITD